MENGVHYDEKESFQNNHQHFSSGNRQYLENYEDEQLHSSSHKIQELNKPEENVEKKNIFIKIKKNLFLMLVLFLLLFLYYVYMNNVVMVILSRSNKGLDVRFWEIKNYEDNHYFLCVLYLAVFHILYFLLLMTLIKTSLTCPGFLDKNYIDTFDIRASYEIMNQKSEDSNRTDRSVENKYCNHKLLNVDLPEIKGSKFFDLFEKIEEQTDAIKFGLFQKLFDSLDSHNALKRVCKFCEVIKPDRSHHCRACRKCVLKYDHHCYIVNNCIGFHNYKYFFLLILYLNSLLIFVIISSVYPFLLHFQELGMSDKQTIIFILFAFMCMTVFGFSLELVIFHIKIMCKGVTTVENLKMQSNPDNTENQPNSNLKTNGELIEESLGSNAISWFLPTKPNLKYGGYIFNDDIERLKEIILKENK